MSDTYTKLFSSITESTVWGESYATRIVWVTMLAMADASGKVYGSIPGLARRANVTLQEAEAAIHSFMSPDPYSRTKDDDGRRIAEIDGGWALINHAKYGAIRGEEERREYKRQWDRNNRSSGHQRAVSSDTVRQQSDSSPTKTDSPTPPALTPTLDLEEQQEQQHVQPMAARCRFAAFWAAYPNKKGKQEAEKTWKRRKLDGRCDELIGHVRLMEAHDDGWRRGYVPMGSTYLNQARWEDVPQESARAGPQTSQPVTQMGKTAQALMALEAFGNGGLDQSGNCGGPQKAHVLGPGADPGSGGDPAD
ncbi:hypothetical protein ORG27_14855, partial [Stenotrophomonas lactitubi]|uniref:hypothetical protein n=1 Tax=Stenotrophomonas lactitubi TaxID=2045214 RepID=UPI0022497122